MSYQNSHIEELATLCQQQNQKAQFEVYNRYCKAMYNVAFRIVKDEHFAEDVMQESFLRAFTKIDTYKKEVAFGAWLKRIVINYSIDFCKKNHKLKMDDFEKNLYKIEEKETDFIEVTHFDEIKIKEVLNAIQSLKTSYSTILTLFYIEGYDQEEISEILRISYANCRTTLSRAKESLKNKLREYDQ